MHTTPILNSSSSSIFQDMPKVSRPRLDCVAWRRSVQILHKYTDVISSVGILAVTTCLLAAKIFSQIPTIIPRTGQIILNYIGIISINIQIRECLKSGKDFLRAYSTSNLEAFIETSVKVFVKGVNILLTCSFFAASIAAFGGFPEIASGIYLTLRPLALSALIIGIASDVWDYFINERLLNKLHSLENDPAVMHLIARTAKFFFECILDPKIPSTQSQAMMPEEQRLAERLVRQLDAQTLEVFQDNIAATSLDTDDRTKTIKLFYSIKDSLLSKHAWTKSHLNLLALGYASMGICRAYPDTIVEMTVRWCMSAFYTEELLVSKFFQSDLAEVLTKIIPKIDTPLKPNEI